MKTLNNIVALAAVSLSLTAVAAPKPPTMPPKPNTLSKLAESIEAQDLRIDSLEQSAFQFQTDMATFREELKSVEQGLASTIALGGLVDPRYGGDTSVSMALGSYKDSQAVAVGFTQHYESGMSVKVAVSADPNEFSDTIAVSSSIGFSW